MRAKAHEWPAFTGFPGRGRGGSSWLSFSDLSVREASIRTHVAVRAHSESRRLPTWGWGRPRVCETKPRGSPFEGLPRSTDGAPRTGEPHCPFPAASPSCKQRGRPPTRPPPGVRSGLSHRSQGHRVRQAPAPLALTKASLGAFLTGAILLGSIFSSGSSTTEIELQAVSTSTRLHPCGGWKAVLACSSPAWAASQPPAPTCVGLATLGPWRL